MSSPSAHYRLATPPDGPAVMRSGTVVWRSDRSLTVVDAAGARQVQVDWELYRHQLTPDGRYLLVLGDQARRAQVLDLRSGQRVLDILGDETRRHSLRVGVGPIGDQMFAFVASRAKPNVLSLISLATGQRQGWLSTAGMIGFAVDRVLSLGAGWLGIQGHGDGEQYDTVVAVPAAEVLDDVEALQTALREPRVKQWGYRVAIGPVAGGHTVTFRDPEWDDDQPPDDPDEAFCGLLVHDPATGAVIERIAYAGALVNGATLGGDATWLAVEVGDRIEAVARSTGVVHPVEGVALDPHRLEVARVDGPVVTIESLASIV